MPDPREKKRKREGAESARKKVKTKGEVRQEGEVELQEVATPSVAKRKDSNKSQALEANEIISSPASARKEKRKKKSKASEAEALNGTAIANDNDPAESQSKSSKQSRPQKPSPSKLESGESRNPPGKSTEKSKKENKHTTGKEVVQPKTNGAIPQKSEKKKKKSRKSPSWSISEPLGGWFLPQDPIFSADEKHLILANARSLQVYSTETSLLAKALPLNSQYLSTYSLSSINPNHIYTANSEGRITLWDWAEDKEIGHWEFESNIRRISVVRQPQSEHDLVYSHELGKRHIVNVHAICTTEKGVQMELKQIYKTKLPIVDIQVLLEGKIVVITTHNSIAIGKRTKLHKTALQDFEYTWREFQTSKRITCSNAFVRAPEQEGGAAQAAQSQRDHIDLAFGDQDGMIYHFEDVLTSLVKLEKSQKGDPKPETVLEMLRPKRLHWHREAVGSVKWSRDGNYLISGGNETVLILWQLSTGKQQHLPHLTAAIENIVVSLSGSSYSITLANNSVIVLSTSELEAKTNIIGMQSRRVDLERLPRENNSRDYSFDLLTHIPMVTDPKNPNQILFTVPSSQPRHHAHGLLPETYLQSFNIASQRPVARQALARNNVTDPNVGPDGRKILEPNIKFMQISNDGKWLATVDEWIPPQPDMGYIDEGIPEFNEEERTFRREVYLKFWRWDEKNTQWTLESRIDAPHFLESVSANARVLDLVADPSEAGFATLGEDRYVRIWRPKTRMRNGITVRGADKNKGDGLITWSLHRSIGFSSSLDVLDPSTNEHASVVPQTAHLAFSPDGSVLAAGISFGSESDTGVIYIIDAVTGAIRRPITELDVTSLSCLGISGRHLIVVADSVALWDLVTDELVYSIPFDTPGVDRFGRTLLVRLAINEEHRTFAVSWPQFETNDPSKARGTRYFMNTSSKISIFDPYHPKALWSRTVPGIVLSLVSSNDGPGYITLDSSSSIRLVSPKAKGLQLITPPPETPQLAEAEQGHKRDLEEELSDEGEDKHSILAGTEDLVPDLENDKPVVRPEQLQEIFDIGPSHALPPVKDLFNAVVGLYARKPKVIGAV